ncbi:MAG: lipopolysaccharide biosynthesis protein [Sphingobacteriaceae bacterium]|nr:MAG: lipopolysaccharide biosynthesis protein [Sphingobacteriaceae bacterium]
MTTNKDSEEISLKELLWKLNAAFKFIISKWLTILLFTILGCGFGFLYSYYKKPVYTATSTFVLEDNKTGGLGQYASLASLAGIDVGTGGAGGVFQGDNILELYKSRIMIEKALLSKANFAGRKMLLIDRYIDFNKLREKWNKKDHISLITFSGNPDKFNRKQDSIITAFVELFNKKILIVDKLDKKLSIIKVSVTTNDELFSKEFNAILVQTVNNFYTQTKTKKSYQNVQVLQKQADSVKSILNYSIGGVASAIDAAPNANPLQLRLRVPSQRKQVDVQANTAIYSEIVKNLEVSKISLRQEIPLIQVIDQPILPLPVNYVGKLTGLAIGGFLGFLLTIAIISVRKFFSILTK